MTTLVKASKAFARTVNDRRFMSEIWSAVVLSTGDIVLAVFVTTVALLAMLASAGPEATSQVATPYILVNFLLTMRRVIQRVDYHWTVDELATVYLRDAEDIKRRIANIESEVGVTFRDEITS